MAPEFRFRMLAGGFPVDGVSGREEGAGSSLNRVAGCADGNQDTLRETGCHQRYSGNHHWDILCTFSMYMTSCFHCIVVTAGLHCDVWQAKLEVDAQQMADELDIARYS